MNQLRSKQRGAAYSAAIAILHLCHANAAEPEKSPKEEAAEKFQIIDQQEVVLDSRSIIYNRVVAPQPNTALPRAASTASVSEPSAGTERKIFRSISPFVTVYDGRFSEMDWRDEKGSLRIVSNIDMNLFGASGTFETTDTAFSYLLMIRNDSLADLPDTRHVERARSTLADLSLTPQARAGYIIIEGQAADHSDAMTALNALHGYYNANREQIIRAHEAREIAERERQRQLREHPPVPKDTVINYWPKKNSIYLNEKP